MIACVCRGERTAGEFRRRGLPTNRQAPMAFRGAIASSPASPRVCSIPSSGRHMPSGGIQFSDLPGGTGQVSIRQLRRDIVSGLPATATTIEGRSISSGCLPSNCRLGLNIICRRGPALTRCLTRCGGSTPASANHRARMRRPMARLMRRRIVALHSQPGT
jgi:hypothetical protein